MVYGKDYKKNLTNRRQASLKQAQHRWILRGFLFIVGISLIGVVLAKTHQTLGHEQQAGQSPKDRDITTETDTTPLDVALPIEETDKKQRPPEDIMAEPQPAWETITVKKGDTASSIFSELNIHSQLHDLLKLPEAEKKLTHLVPGESFDYLIDNDRKLTAIRYDESDTRHVHFSKLNEAFEMEVVEDDVETRVTMAQGTIADSLFVAGKDAGISDNLIMNLVDIFAYDIDYALDIRSGDQFKLIYEERYANGRRLKDGKILGAQFTNQGQTHQALQFTSSSGTSAYYTPDGRNLKKAFIRTPVKFSRISSPFDPKRMHPILHKIKAHRGVDYAAPIGTPIKATGSGKVIFVGNKHGYGKTIVLQHGQRYSTLYAHLSEFRKGLRNGQKITQGQVIGYVGMSGRATGPHLHYEFRVNGVHKNPVTVKLPAAPPLPENELRNFKTATRALLTQLESDRLFAQAGSE